MLGRTENGKVSMNNCRKFLIGAGITRIQSENREFGTETDRTQWFSQNKFTTISGEIDLNGETAEGDRNLHRTIRTA